MLNYRILMALAALFSISSFAIVDVQKPRETTGRDANSIIVGSAISGKSGNADILDISTNLEIHWTGANRETLLLAEQSFTETDGSKSGADSMAHLRRIHHLDTANALEYYAQVQYDDIRGLKQRTLAGTNVRLKRFVTNEISENYIGVGAFYFTQRYTDPLEGGRYKHDGVRMNLYWSHKRSVGLSSNFSSTLYMQPKVDDIDDLDVLLVVTLESALTKTLSLNVSAKYSRMDVAPEGFESDEMRYHTGLTYSF